MEPIVDPDAALVLACQQGDPPSWSEPFRVLHERHWDVVHRICLRITGDGQEALDAAQDAFLLAFRGLQGFRFQSRFSRWLFRIAAHASAEHWRKRDPLLDMEELDGERTCAPEDDPSSAAEKRDRRRRIRRAIHALPPHLREVLLLRYFENLTYPEIEARLGIAPGSVRSRLHRAHDALGWKLRALALE
jgi:RNA polymerase sigma-70 factor (ECF subfamily)